MVRRTRATSASPRARRPDRIAYPAHAAASARSPAPRNGPGRARSATLAHVDRNSCPTGEANTRVGWYPRMPPLRTGGGPLAAASGSRAMHLRIHGHRPTRPGTASRRQTRRRTPREQRGPILNRELSWIEFNARVLHEARDERNPLLERVKFLAIFAVATSTSSSRSGSSGLRRQAQAGSHAPRARRHDGRSSSWRRSASASASSSPTTRRSGWPSARSSRRGRRDPRLRRGPRAPRDAPPAVPRRDLPGAHAARRRPRPPVPVHQHAQPLDRGRAARPGDRRAALRAGQDPAPAPAPVRGRARQVRAPRPGHRGQPRRAVPGHGDRRDATCSGSPATPTSRSRRTRRTTCCSRSRRRSGAGGSARPSGSRSSGRCPASRASILISGIGVREEDVLRGLGDARPHRRCGSSSTSTGRTSRRRPGRPVVPPRLLPPDEDEPVDVFAPMRAGDILVHHPYESFTASRGAVHRARPPTTPTS